MGQNKVCHHIEFDDNCDWCRIDYQQVIHKCDRCGHIINSDIIYLSVRKEPQLLCAFCYNDDIKWRV